MFIISNFTVWDNYKILFINIFFIRITLGSMKIKNYTYFDKIVQLFYYLCGENVK